MNFEKLQFFKINTMTILTKMTIFAERCLQIFIFKIEFLIRKEKFIKNNCSKDLVKNFC